MNGTEIARRLILVVLAFSLVVSPSLSAGIGLAGAAPATHADESRAETRVAGVGGVPTVSETFRVDYRVSLSEDSDNVTVRLTLYDHPSLGSFRVRLPDGSTVTDTRGFERLGPEEWGWSGSPSKPTLTYEIPTSERGDTRLRGADWAIVSGVEGRYGWTAFDEIDIRRTYTTDDGYSGDRAVAVGNVTLRSFDGPNGNTTVVAPTATTDDVAFDEVGATVVDLDEWMPFGGANPRTNVFVVPSDREIGGAGLAVGGGDFLVEAHHLPPDSPTNVLAHEYTHTRQSFDTGEGMEWVTEGGAEYYEERYVFERQVESFDWYRDRASAADRSYSDATLSEVGGRSSAAYSKGAHVLLALDTLLRRQTDGDARIDDVFDRMNAHDGPVDYDDFRSMVRAEAGTSLDGWLDLYVRGGSLPPLPENASLVAPAGWTSTDAPDDLYFCLGGEWRTGPSLLPAGEPVAVFDHTHAVVDLSGAERVGTGTGDCSLGALPVESPDFGGPSDKFGRPTATEYVFEDDTTLTLRSAFDPDDVTTLDVAVVDQSTPTPTASPTPTSTATPAESGSGGTATPAGRTATAGEGATGATPMAADAAAGPDVPPLVVEPRGSGVLVKRGSVSALFPLPILVGMVGFLASIAGGTYLLLRE